MSKTTIPAGGITDSAVTTAKINADAVTAAKIADDAISEEHLDATAITGHTALAETPADTDELIISDAGTLKRLDFSHIKASPGLNFITEASSSSNHSEVVLTNCFSSTYENYLIIGDISLTNDSDTIRARLKDSSGNQLTGSQYTYRFKRSHADSNDQSLLTRAAGDSYFQLTETLNADSARVSYTFKMHIFDPVSSSKRMGLTQESIFVKADAIQGYISGGGQYKDQISITSILFYPSANNFANSTIRVYGYSNS